MKSDVSFFRFVNVETTNIVPVYPGWLTRCWRHAPKRQLSSEVSACSPAAYLSPPIDRPLHHAAVARARVPSSPADAAPGLGARARACPQPLPRSRAACGESSEGPSWLFFPSPYKEAVRTCITQTGADLAPSHLLNRQLLPSLRIHSP